LVLSPAIELLVMTTSVALGFLIARSLRSYARSRNGAAGSASGELRLG
jgi:hypothetical protein